MSSTTDYRAIDKVVGGILLFYSGIGVLCGAGLTFMSSAATVWLHSQQSTSESAFPVALFGVGFAMIGVVMMLCYGLNTVGAIAVMRGRRWGHLLSAILLGVTALGSLSGASGYLTTIPEAGACVYLALRFAGQIGTAPS